MSRHKELHYMEVDQHILKVGVTYEGTNAYLFVPKGRFEKFQRWLFNKLVKRGVFIPYMERRNVYHKISFDQYDFVEQLYQQYRGLLDQYRGRDRITTAYVGKDDFFRMISLRDQGMNSILTFDVQHPKLFDLNVVVVPYMKGVLFV